MRMSDEQVIKKYSWGAGGHWRLRNVALLVRLTRGRAWKQRTAQWTAPQGCTWSHACFLLRRLVDATQPLGALLSDERRLQHIVGVSTETEEKSSQMCFSPRCIATRLHISASTSCSSADQMHRQNHPPASPIPRSGLSSNVSSQHRGMDLHVWCHTMRV